MIEIQEGPLVRLVNLHAIQDVTAIWDGQQTVLRLLDDVEYRLDVPYVSFRQRLRSLVPHLLSFLPPGHWANDEQ